MYRGLGPFIPRGCRHPRADKPAETAGGGVARCQAGLVLGVSVAPTESYKLCRPSGELADVCRLMQALLASAETECIIIVTVVMPLRARHCSKRLWALSLESLQPHQLSGGF